MRLCADEDGLQQALEDLKALAQAGSSSSERDPGQRSGGVFELLKSYAAFVHALAAQSRPEQQQADDERQQQGARGALLGLLQNAALPRAARLHVLFSAVQLLEQNLRPPLFSAADTRQLLTHLQVRVA